MSSLSSRVGLTVMNDTDFVDPAVITKDNTKLDAITSLTQCTSTTRPATPFEGQWIYETDTQNIRRWSQSDGKWYLRGGSGIASAVGLVAQFSNGNAAQLAGTGGGQNIQMASLHDYNATLQNGHTYKIIEQGWYNLSGTYQQNSFYIFPEFFTTVGVGSNPALSDAGSLHYFSQPYQQNMNPARKGYYKAFSYTVPGNSGTSTVYFRSIMRVDASTYPTFNSLGRPSTSFPARAFIYDMGIVGAN